MQVYLSKSTFLYPFNMFVFLTAHSLSQIEVRFVGNFTAADWTLPPAAFQF